MRSASRRRTVLVVEDDASLRTLYHHAFEVAGYHVVEAEDGLEALRRIESDGVDALVLDLKLPRVSGADVQHELAANPRTRHIPIVVATGTDTGALDDSSVASVLKKPVHPEVVVAAIDKALARRVRVGPPSPPQMVPDAPRRQRKRKGG